MVPDLNLESMYLEFCLFIMDTISWLKSKPAPLIAPSGMGSFDVVFTRRAILIR